MVLSSKKVWKGCVFSLHSHSSCKKDFKVLEKLMSSYTWRVNSELWLKKRSSHTNTHTQWWGCCRLSGTHCFFFFRQTGHQADMLKCETAKSCSNWHSRVWYHQEVLQFLSSLPLVRDAARMHFICKTSSSKSRHFCVFNITHLHKH